MNRFLGELNNDQLDGLAKLCFDLSKGSFLIALFPTPNLFSNPTTQVINIAAGIITGIAFIYHALVILRLKEKLR